MQLFDVEAILIFIIVIYYRAQAIL